MIYFLCILRAAEKPHCLANNRVKERGGREGDREKLPLEGVAEEWD